jgi:pyridoxamine 5'-phosphate oxidase family protein
LKELKEHIMSKFSPAEVAYLKSQMLGRLATVGPDGQPHVVPVGFRYNEDLDTIDIGGHNDDLASIDPWRARGIEIRGEAEILETGGATVRPGFDPEMFRITVEHIVSWGIDPLKVSS